MALLVLVPGRGSGLVRGSSTEVQNLGLALVLIDLKPPRLPYAIAWPQCVPLYEIHYPSSCAMTHKGSEF